MLINIRPDEEATSSGFAAKSMGFDMSKQAKLFHMLSNSLYSNKQGSIIREIASNCHDAHVMAGRRDTPFVITAPTLEKPEIRFQDFGVGLTAEEAEQTILCYLGSTKDNSDDFIGGWGIGSKSPFAYSKNYNVVVTKLGRQVEFAVWKDAAALPRNAVIRDEVVDAPNGVEIRIPVLTADVRKWRDALNEYMDWTNYNVVADMGNDVMRRPRVPEDSVDMGDYIVNLYSGGDGNVRLVYGGYSYDMESCIEEGADWKDRWEEVKESMVDHYDIAIIANKPGSLDFNMNREELEQTPKSIAFISGPLNFMVSEVEAANAFFKPFEASNGAQAIDLQEVQDRIAGALAEATANARVVTKAFKVGERKFQYSMKGEAYRVSRHSRPARMHRLEYLAKPLEAQIAFSWGRHRNPTYAHRAVLGGKEREYIFVKANTEAEARDEIKKSPDFARLNLDAFEFIHIVIPKTVYTGGGGGSGAPRPYNVTTRSFIKWDGGDIYVMIEPGEDLTKHRFAKAAANLGRADVHFFTPTAEFKKKWSDELDNVYTSAEFLEAYWEDACKRYCEAVPLELRTSVQKLRDHLHRWQHRGIPVKAKRLARSAFNCVDSVLDETIVISPNVVPPAGLVQRAVKINAVKRAGERVMGLCARLEAKLRYVNVDNLYRNRNKADAKELITALKIGEWMY